MPAPTPLERLEKRAASCVHFNGMMNDCCLAGVNYSTVSPDIPCIPMLSRQTGTPKVCPKFQAAGMEAALRREKEIEKDIRRITIAATVVKAHSKGQRGVTANIKCPICTHGTLRYSIAKLNGHLWMNCSTPECVAMVS